jgi:subtilisin family serine protease
LISRPHLARLARPLAVAAIFALTGCGRTVPMAPIVSERDGDTHVGAAYQDRNLVVVWIEEDVDLELLGKEYRARIVEPESWHCAGLVSEVGEPPEKLAARLAEDARIVSAEPNHFAETAETRQQSWAFDDGNGSPEAWAGQPVVDQIGLSIAHATSEGSGVLVAVLDTGADPQHPALAGRIVGGWDFVENDADPTDTGDYYDNDYDGLEDEAVGHGTHVAGIVALTAPGARILVARVLDSDGRGSVGNVMRAIQWARARGARVVNLSLGFLEESPGVERALALAERDGMIAVASAGNRGAEEPAEYPARSHLAIGVAAVDVDDVAASFTSFGPHVDLCAPGVAIRSAYPGERWMLWSGTSMSAPFVSGVSALLLSRRPDWHLAEVQHRLGATARPVSTPDPARVGKLGAGALDAGLAVGNDPGEPSPDDPLRLR